MASLICPNCGKDNPDFLDDCQFCQTPLRREATLNIGEEPTKKSTGELEGVLPDWLKEARQQARDLAEEEAAKEATKPKIQKEEPLDLLAGLAYQAASEEEEVPDWLAAINPIKEEQKIPGPPSKPSAEEKPSDFFAQFEQIQTPVADSAPTIPMSGEIQPEEALPWMSETGGTQKDELSDWFSQSNEPFKFDEGEAPASISPEPAAPEQPEDLSWLRDLEASTKQPPATPAAPQADMGWMSNLESTSGSQEDLGWLNNLGGMPATPASQPESQAEDLGWLNNLGGTPLPEEPAAPVSSQAEDLGWLDNLGGTPAPSEPAPAREDLSWLDTLGGTPAAEPSASGDDLSWLNQLGGTPAPSEPAAPQGEDLSWLDNLGGTPETPPGESATATPFVQSDMPDWLKSIETQPMPESGQPPQYSPARTAPLSEDAMQGIPDWLKSATEQATTASMPPLGAASKDWFTSREKTADAFTSAETRQQPAEQAQGPFSSAPGEYVPAEQDFFSTQAETPPLANQDVDALFAVEMPDWLSQPETGAAEEAAFPQGTEAPSVFDEALAPVNLPSWVQAMRPVEAAISEASAVSADQPVEREGPLAGLRGVIPFVPIGSSQRPKAISLKLQATAEQQAGASLLEQIIAGEAAAQPAKAASLVLSQRALRWTLAGLFLVVLSVMVALGSQFMPISASMPAEVSNAANVVVTLPEGAPVLVVMDYEPSLAGEMEAAAGPLLDQLAVLRKPVLTFVAGSPNGTGLAKRLLAKAGIDRSGLQYSNAGYLPGGLAGIRGFTEAPQTVLPSVSVTQFSEFAAVILITDQAESGQVWIEQMTLAKQSNPALANQHVLVVASAQAGPMLKPYVASRQAAGMISGIPDAARYEFVNNSRPGMVRSYWDAFNIGLLLAVVAIVLGSLWNVFSGLRARRAEAEQG